MNRYCFGCTVADDAVPVEAEVDFAGDGNGARHGDVFIQIVIAVRYIATCRCPLIILKILVGVIMIGICADRVAAGGVLVAGRDRCFFLYHIAAVGAAVFICIRVVDKGKKVVGAAPYGVSACKAA